MTEAVLKTRWTTRLIASRGFQKWAARFPFTRAVARREGEALFDLVSGFVYSQVLYALVTLDIPQTLKAAPRSSRALGAMHGIEERKMEALLQAAQALKLVQKRKGAYELARRGAALIGVPGLEAMIRHHDVFYRDLTDPVALLRGETETELANFWPYVFGGEMPAEQAKTYSDLMADSQGLVAEDTLRMINLGGITRLMDVGGGSGAFLSAVQKAAPKLSLCLFDLPDVAPQARARLGEGVELTSGSFKTDSLPEGADAISLIRVLYDHSDETVRDLLAKVYTALPAGGRLIISEPMTGGVVPHGPGNAYFAFYCMAMQTGRARSAEEIAQLCTDAGFEGVRIPRAPRPFVTSVVEAVRPR